MTGKSWQGEVTAVRLATLGIYLRSARRSNAGLLREFPKARGSTMQDYQTYLEKLRTDAAECRSISDLATDPAKRELFDRLALYLTTLADQVELAMQHRKPG